MHGLKIGARALACVLLLAVSACYAGRSASAAAPQAPTFVGKFELVPLFAACKPPKPGVVQCPVIVNGHQYYAERNSFGLRTAAGDLVQAFAGATTDLASIPQVVWPVMPPDGPWAKAAAIHDACYKSKGAFTWRGRVGRSRPEPYDRAGCDEILREGMLALGVPAWQRITIYEAVRLGGSAGWGR